MILSLNRPPSHKMIYKVVYTHWYLKVLYQEMSILHLHLKGEPLHFASNQLSFMIGLKLCNVNKFKQEISFIILQLLSIILLENHHPIKILSISLLEVVALRKLQSLISSNRKLDLVLDKKQLFHSQMLIYLTSLDYQLYQIKTLHLSVV